MTNSQPNPPATIPPLKAWAAILFLLFLDFLIDIQGGGVGHPVWQPIMNLLNIQTVYYLTPFILAAFFLLIKFGSLLGLALEDLFTPPAQSLNLTQITALVRTSLVIAYALYNLWLFSVNHLGFTLITPSRNRHLLLLILSLIVIAYGFWAEQKIKSKL